MPVAGELVAVAGRPTVVALRALGLGDLLVAVPALRALAAAYPRHRRVLAAPRTLAPLVALIGPDPARLPGPGERAVDAVVEVPAWVGGGGAPARAWAAALPARPEVAVNLHGRGPESHRLLLAAGPRALVAFAHPDVPETAGAPRWDGREHEATRWCRLLAAHGIAADPAALDLPLPPLPPGAAPPASAVGPGRWTIVHPGAASAARRWPPARWAAVARAEARAGRPVLVTGAAAEAPLARRVARLAGLPPAAAVAGATDPRGLAAVVGRAGRVVCGDTGVAHLATALGTPSVVLFGPVAPSRWGPPPDRPWHRALWRGAAGDPHGDRPHPGLLAIGPADVVAALAALPDPPRR